LQDLAEDQHEQVSREAEEEGAGDEQQDSKGPGGAVGVCMVDVEGAEGWWELVWGFEMGESGLTGAD
jgi:hypothetical protein